MIRRIVAGMAWSRITCELFRQLRDDFSTEGFCLVQNSNDEQ